MKAIDADQRVIVPIVDNEKGMQYEIQIAVGKLLEESLEDQVETVEAIPVTWLREKAQKPCMTTANPFDYALNEWEREQATKAP